MMKRFSIRSAATLLLCAAPAFAAPVTLQHTGNKIEISVDGHPFTTYFFDPSIAKPYLMPLRTASGVVITRGFPVGNDVSAGNPKASSFEPHQRAMYFGHGDIDGLDFWQEEVFDKYYTDHGHQGYGHVILKKLEESAASGDSAKVRARFTLNDPHNRVIGEELQTFTFRGDAKLRTIDCEIVLTATAGPLDIGDTKEGTFAIRLAPELSGSHAHMLNSEGAVGEKAIWGKPANWVQFSGEIGGHPVGVAIFDSPKSFRHPTTWHARAYGLFAANPFGTREFTRDENKDGSWAIPETKSLTFRYQVLIHDGSLSREQLEQVFEKYAAGER